MAAEPLLSRFAQHVASTPDKTLFRFLGDDGSEARCMTYAEVDAETRSLAMHLLGKGGIGCGDRVMLVYPPGLDFIIAFLACLRAGIVAVPVYPPIPTRLAKDLNMFVSVHETCGATVALTNNQYNWAKKAVGLKNKFVKSGGLKWPEMSWIVTDKINLKKVADVPLPAPAQEDVAFLQFTSGSTADPKGVMVAHSNLADNLRTIIDRLRASDATVVVSWLPQYHDMGLIGSYMGAMYCGGSGVYMSPVTFIRNPPLWVQTVSKYKGTHLQSPNFGYKLCARKFGAMKKQPLLDLSSVEHMFNAAEPVTAESCDMFLDQFAPHGLDRGTMVPGYGLAEHTVYVCDGGKQRLRVDKQRLEEANEAVVVDEGTAGSGAGCVTLMGGGDPKGTPGIDVRIVNDDGVEQNDDAVGEIWIDSPSKAVGYWGLEEVRACVGRSFHSHL